MTKEELRKTKEYQDLKEEIKKYEKGYEFTYSYNQLTKRQFNAIRVFVLDCIKEKLIESKSIGLDIKGDMVEESFIKL